jgi:hypothetical protein
MCITTAIPWEDSYGALIFYISGYNILQTTLDICAWIIITL